MTHYSQSDLRYGLNKGHPTTALPKVSRPSQRKGVQSTKNKFVRSVIREVAGFSPYERRVLELLRNSKVRCYTRMVTNAHLRRFSGQEGAQVDQETGKFWLRMMTTGLTEDSLVHCCDRNASWRSSELSFRRVGGPTKNANVIMWLCHAYSLRVCRPADGVNGGCAEKPIRQQRRRLRCSPIFDANLVRHRSVTGCY